MCYSSQTSQDKPLNAKSFDSKKRNFLLVVYRMLQRKSQIHHFCGQKYFRQLNSYRNALDLICHIYVVEATLESKCMYFQDCDYAVRRGAEEMDQHVCYRRSVYTVL